MEIPTHSGLFSVYTYLITLHYFGEIHSEIADGIFRRRRGHDARLHARVEMASARVVGAAKSLDARVKAIIQAVPYCFLESREHELGTV